MLLILTFFNFPYIMKQIVLTLREWALTEHWEWH